MVTPALFKRYQNARAVGEPPPTNSSRRFTPRASSARNRKRSSAWRSRRRAHGGEVPASMDALVKLPGVGRKTANVVLGHALGVPGLPVDRHVLRVANRIGIAESDNPEVVEQQLCEALPRRALDAHVGYADSARAAHLPAEAGLRALRRAGRLRLLRLNRETWGRGASRSRPATRDAQPGRVPPRESRTGSAQGTDRRSNASFRTRSARSPSDSAAR